MLAKLTSATSAGAKKKLLCALSRGEIDLLVGTHAVLGANFLRLGLVAIDEEHRFGVRHKEKIAALSGSCHLLQLSATPIPRTLEQSFSGLRTMSIMATPPAGRLAVLTRVVPKSVGIIKEAVGRELLRQGQVFYVYNEVATMAKEASWLRELLPQAKIDCVHGQLRPVLIERVMQRLYSRDLDVLICSTIIESGLDLPGAGTVIVNRADLLGLAQLHQLRGRVGRAQQQAYAYFLTAEKKSSRAKVRLEALAAAKKLGSGMHLAIRDLEARGAGEMLGYEQSGHMEKLGVELYVEMVQRACEKIKASGEAEFFQADLDLSLDAGDLQTVEIDVGDSALIPQSYVKDPVERLLLYRRLSRLEADLIEDFKAELKDRFGHLPPEVNRLFRNHRLAEKAKKQAINYLRLHAGGGEVKFTQAVQVAKVASLLQADPDSYKMASEGIVILKSDPSSEQRYRRLENFVATIAGYS